MAKIHMILQGKGGVCIPLKSARLLFLTNLDVGAIAWADNA